MKIYLYSQGVYVNGLLFSSLKQAVAYCRRANKEPVFVL